MSESDGHKDGLVGSMDCHGEWKRFAVWRMPHMQNTSARGWVNIVLEDGCGFSWLSGSDVGPAC